ncbi:MAG: glycosyltransferase family 1 protein [Flavobacteriia bacterium]|nr:glycosyltransferase family 1 protein [Flavobacteriia bacterium]
MGEEKHKVLFIVAEFFQSGASRYMYEINKTINKHAFDLEILCFHPLNHSQTWQDVYYEKNLALGTAIHFWDDVNVLYRPTLMERIQRKINNKPFPHERKPLHDYLEKFDHIILVGEYLYPAISRFFREKDLEKTYVSIQNSIFQNPKNYLLFDKQKRYRFISSFEDSMIQLELQEFSDYTHYFFPLSITIQEEFVKTDFEKTANPKIGIFTRLCNTKPLSPFFEAFRQLLESIPFAELHIFGTGDPQQEGMVDEIRALGIESAVFFRGHSYTMVETAVNENLTLTWMHSYYGIPGGFASFDLCTTKIPQLFWNFTPNFSVPDNVCYPMFNDTTTFVHETMQLLQHPEEAQKLGLLQFEDVTKHRDIAKNCRILEKILRNNG